MPWCPWLIGGKDLGLWPSLTNLRMILSLVVNFCHFTLLALPVKFGSCSTVPPIAKISKHNFFSSLLFHTIATSITLRKSNLIIPPKKCLVIKSLHHFPFHCKTPSPFQHIVAITIEWKHSTIYRKSILLFCLSLEHFLISPFHFHKQTKIKFFWPIDLL